MKTKEINKFSKNNEKINRLSPTEQKWTQAGKNTFFF